MLAVSQSEAFACRSGPVDKISSWLGRLPGIISGVICSVYPLVRYLTCSCLFWIPDPAHLITFTLELEILCVPSLLGTFKMKPSCVDHPTGQRTGYHFGQGVMLSQLQGTDETP